MAGLRGSRAEKGTFCLLSEEGSEEAGLAFAKSTETSMLVGAGKHNSFPVQAGALCWMRGQHPKACLGEVEKVPRECIFFSARRVRR